MVAPMDATATLDAGGEQITLAMNFRTIAIAEDAKEDVVTGFGEGRTNVSSLALLVWAFAQPAHPALSHDQALTLVFQHGAAVGTALRTVFQKASAPAVKGDSAAHPPAGGAQAA
nr:hypothetical protein [uncultured organism]